VLAPSIAAPIFALVIAAIATSLARRLTNKTDNGTKSTGMRIGQIGSTSLLSIAHGTNDAQKTMGVVTLALIANGTLAQNQDGPPENTPTKRQAPTPTRVVLTCGLAIAAGTMTAGGASSAPWAGIHETESDPRFTAQITSSVVHSLLQSFRYASLDHVRRHRFDTRRGVGTRKRTVRWRLAGRVATAWLITLPAAGVCGALAYYGQRAFGVSFGVVVMTALLICYCTFHLSAFAQGQDQRAQRERPLG